jgi:hypothetical protein
MLNVIEVGENSYKFINFKNKVKLKILLGHCESVGWLIKQSFIFEIASSVPSLRSGQASQ